MASRRWATGWVEVGSNLASITLMELIFPCRTLLESQGDGPGPTATASPGGIRDDSVQEMVPKKPALNDPPPGAD